MDSTNKVIKQSGRNWCISAAIPQDQINQKGTREQFGHCVASCWDVCTSSLWCRNQIGPYVALLLYLYKVHNRAVPRCLFAEQVGCDWSSLTAEREQLQPVQQDAERASSYAQQCLRKDHTGGKASNRIHLAMEAAEIATLTAPVVVSHRTVEVQDTAAAHRTARRHHKEDMVEEWNIIRMELPLV